MKAITHIGTHKVLKYVGYKSPQAKVVKPTNHITDPIRLKAIEKIIAYYSVAGNDYFTWSRNYNMHFGFYKWPMNPFNREPQLNEMNQQVLERLKVLKKDPPKFQVLADLGCGVGATARYISNVAGTSPVLLSKESEVGVLGVTIVPWQVSKGNELSEMQKVDDKVVLIEADYADIPIESNSLDGAYALESVCHAPGADKKSFVEEAHRILKPGSKLVVCDGFLKHSNPLGRMTQYCYDQIREGWAIAQFADINLFTAELQRVGFTDIKVEDVSWKVAPSVSHVPATFVRFMITKLMGGGMKELQKENWNNLKGSFMTMLLGINRRSFSYYIVSATKGNPASLPSS